MRKGHFFIKILFCTLGVFFFLNAYFLVNQYRSLRASGALHASFDPRRRGFPAAPLGEVSLSDAGAIREWMTFEYINSSFRLPPEYLKTKLDIPNGRYPRLTLQRAAKMRGEEEEPYVQSVRAAIREYQNAH